METLVEVISACVEAHSPMGPLGSRYLAPGCSLDLHVLLATVTGGKPARGFPMAWGPTTQTAHGSPSRGSRRATTSGGAWRPPSADAEPGLRLFTGAPL